MKSSLKRIFERRKERSVKKPRRALRIVLIILLICALPVVIGGVVLAGYIMILMQDLPNVNRLEDAFAMSTVIYDRNGNELYKIHGEENRNVVSLENISDHVKHATIAIEDRSFWTRPFLDFRRIISAALNNYVLRSEQLEGASTITQQLIKNVFLTNERTYERKLKEAILAYQVESKYSRERILELYLNQIPYGSNAYGIEQAARTFFDKSALELTLAESAVLASLPNAPTYYSPFGQNPQRLMGYCKNEEIGEEGTATEQGLALELEDVDLTKVEIKIVAVNRVWISVTADGKKEQATLEAGEERVYSGDSIAINLGNNSPNIYANTLPVAIPRNLSFTLTPETIREFLTDPADLDELIAFQNSEQHVVGQGEECTGINDPNWARGRKDLVLLRMLADGYVTQEEVDQAWNDARTLEFKPYRQAITSPHFVFYVKSYLEEKYGKEVETAGWKVYTTIDPALQKKAEDIIKEYGNRNETRYNANQAALVSVEPSTGQILAMVGSRDYWDTERDGNVNITTRRLQPGSSFKPFIYAAMFEGEYGAGSVLWDVRTGFGPLYPNNYDGTFKGPMIVRAALARSLNIPAIKAFFLAGEEEKVLEFLGRVGVTSLIDYKNAVNVDKAPEDQFHYGWPLALGTGEVTPLEMVEGYAVFANNGIHREPISVLEIRDNEGNIVEKWEPDTTTAPVVDPQVAYQITDILSDEAARPAGIWRTQLSVPGHPTASKTGTSNKRYPNGTILPNNLWTVGYTRHLATAVWVGHSRGDALPAGSDGIGVATPIYHEFMKQAHEGKEVLRFEEPAGLKRVTVSTLSGLLASASTPEGYATTGLFASWSAPVKVDDSFVVAKVDKRNGFLANDLCPVDVVQDAIKFNVHSEYPDRPSWENPVQEWARQHLQGLAGEDGEGVANFAFDKESPLCREYAENELPTVSIVSPPAFGSVAKGRVNVKANINAPFGIQKVEYFIDDMFQYEATDHPFDIGYVNMQHRFEDGSEHTIRVRVLDKNYNAASASVTVKIDGDTTPPVVSIVSPGSGESVAQGSTVQISVDAYDDSSNIKEVRVSFAGKRLQTFKQAPYKVALYIDPALYSVGNHTLEVVAVDEQDNTQTATQSLRVTEGSERTTTQEEAGGDLRGSISVPATHEAHSPLRVGVQTSGGAGNYTLTLMRQESGKKAEVIDALEVTAGSAGSYILYWNDPTPGTHEVFLMIKGSGDVSYSSRSTVTVQ